MKNGAFTPLGCCFQSTGLWFRVWCPVWNKLTALFMCLVDWKPDNKACTLKTVADGVHTIFHTQISFLSVSIYSCVFLSLSGFTAFLSHFLLFCSWVIIIFTIIGVVIVFDPLGGKKTFYLTNTVSRNLESSQSGQLLYNVKNTATRVWEKRIRLLCCCIVQDDDHRVAFTSIAELFRTYFSVRWKALFMFSFD